MQQAARLEVAAAGCRRVFKDVAQCDHEAWGGCWAQNHLSNLQPSLLASRFCCGKPSAKAANGCYMTVECCKHHKYEMVAKRPDHNHVTSRMLRWMEL